MKTGVPFDVAASLDDTERLAWVVTLGELETGKTFDWDIMRFPKDP